MDTYDKINEVCKNNNHYKIDISKKQEEEFLKQTICYMCGNPETEQNKLVRDHDHFKQFNNYRGAAHTDCNLKYYYNMQIPVVFHNLKNYDANFIL